jgi:hypothetical protein
MTLNVEPLKYPEPQVTADAGSPTGGVYTNASAAALSPFYVLAAGEKSHDDILARIEKTANVVLVRFAGEAPDRPHRLDVFPVAAAGSTNDQTAGVDAYGLILGYLDGAPIVKVEKLYNAVGTAANSGTIGAGRESGAQVPCDDVTITSTGAIEGHTGGSVAPTKIAAQALGQAGVGLADIGPYRAIALCPYKGTAAGASVMIQRWR